MKSRVNWMFVFALCPLFAACTNNESNVDSEGVANRPLPKMDFHKPKAFKDAVLRLKEIHTALAGAGAIPAPRPFKVVEIIHGTGAAAHSHYHLFDDKKNFDDHEHAEMESAEKLHDVEVDVFTEFVDVARWLPNIAADSNMKKAEWEKVKKLANELEDLLRSTFNDDATDDDNRKNYVGKSETSGGLISQLQELSQSDSEEQKD